MLVYILTAGLQSVIIWVVAAKRVWANWISKFIFISYLIKACSDPKNSSHPRYPHQWAHSIRRDCNKEKWKEVWSEWSHLGETFYFIPSSAPCKHWKQSGSRAACCDGFSPVTPSSIFCANLPANWKQLAFMSSVTMPMPLEMKMMEDASVILALNRFFFGSETSGAVIY